MSKFETISKNTMPKVREALSNYLAIKANLSEETWLLGDDIVVYLAKEVEKGANYNIPVLTKSKTVHLENVTLVLDVEKNKDKLDVLTFYNLIVTTVARIMNEPKFSIETVTPNYLSRFLDKYKVL